MKVSVIIPAGGKGTRIQSGQAKQYHLLDGKEILVRTINVFESLDIINEIVLVVPKNDLISINDNLLSRYNFKKIKSLVVGGKERQDSVRNGLKEVSERCDIVIVHDAVRPFISEDVISNVIMAAKKTGAASVGVKSKDTIKETVSNNLVKGTMPRENLWLTQTPQAFKMEILKRAYKKAYDEDFYGTDDASLVERIGVKVKMVEGSYENIKITTPEDLIIAEALIKKNKLKKLSYRNGFGYDSHRFIAGRKLILGGVEIACEKGLQGHSDADAVIHAICDALLGAAGLEDIGKQFPDTDREYKDISSIILLERVKNILDKGHYSINNVDVTVILEKPKIAFYTTQMVSNIAKVLHVSKECVSIKAKTNEGMGFVGRNEGIAVFAIVSVIKNE